METFNRLLSINKKIFEQRSFFYEILSFLQQEELILNNEYEEFEILYESKNSLLFDKILGILKNKRMDKLQFELIDIYDNFIQKLKNEKQIFFNFINLPIKHENCLEKIKLIDIVTTIQIVHLKKTINLKREKILQNYDFFNFHKIFEEKNTKKILIEGQPGIGKTTHFKYLTCLWAYGKWQTNKKYLLLNVSLNDVNENDDIYHSIIKQNFSDIPFISREIIKYILFSDISKNIIIFFDGVDELQFQNESFQQFLYSDNHNTKIVCWTRNWKAREIADYFDKRFEITGFEKSQLKSFLYKCFSGETNNLMYFLSYLEENNLLNLCKIPLFAMCLFQIYITNENDLPTKKYEILSEFMNLLSEGDFWMKSNVGYELCKICFINLHSKRIFLTLTDKKLFKKMTKNIAITLDKKDSNWYNTEIEFFHLSFQEFLAAKFIIKEYKKNPFFTNSVDKYFIKLKTDNIYNFLDFIKDFSIDLYLLILSKSKLLQKILSVSNRNIQLETREQDEQFFILESMQETWLKEKTVEEIFEAEKIIFRQNSFKSDFLFKYFEEKTLFLLNKVDIRYAINLENVNDISNISLFILNRLEKSNNFNLQFQNITFQKENEKLYVENDNFEIVIFYESWNFCLLEWSYSNKSRILMKSYEERIEYFKNKYLKKTQILSENLCSILIEMLDPKEIDKFHVKQVCENETNFLKEFMFQSKIKMFSFKFTFESSSCFEKLLQKMKNITSITLIDLDLDHHFDFYSLLKAFSSLKSQLKEFSLICAKLSFSNYSMEANQPKKKKKLFGIFNTSKSNNPKSKQSLIIKCFFEGFTKLYSFRLINSSSNFLSEKIILTRLTSSAMYLKHINLSGSRLMLEGSISELEDICGKFLYLKTLIIQQNIDWQTGFWDREDGALEERNDEISVVY